MILAIFCIALLGAALYRWRGHASPIKKYFPKPWPQIVFGLPYASIAAAASYWLALPVGILTYAGLVTGHGQYFLSLHPKSIKPEFVDFALVPFFGADPRSQVSNDSDAFDGITAYGADRLYWRCVAGMALTGLLVTLPAGIACLNPLLALSGALKAPAYMIGHFVFYHSDKEMKSGIDQYGGKINYFGITWLPQHLDLDTEIGEFLTGLFLWGAFGLAIWG